MALSRIRQEDEEVLRDSLPYHWLKGVAQDEEEEARRRRHVAPPPPPPPANGNGNGAERLAISPYAPSRHRHGEHYCYCPQCDYQMTVEEGQKCNLIECPSCGSRMRAVSTGEYRISQAEAAPVVPLLLGLGFFGLLAYLIGKRPFE